MFLYLDQDWVKLLHTQPDDIRKESLEGRRWFLNQKLQNLQELGNDTWACSTLVMQCFSQLLPGEGVKQLLYNLLCHGRAQLHLETLKQRQKKA